MIVNTETVAVDGVTNCIFLPKGRALFQRQKFKRFFPYSLIRLAVVKVGLAVVHISVQSLSLNEI